MSGRDCGREMVVVRRHRNAVEFRQGVAPVVGRLRADALAEPPLDQEVHPLPLRPRAQALPFRRRRGQHGLRRRPLVPKRDRRVDLLVGHRPPA